MKFVFCIQFDCCGVDGLYEFSYLEGIDGYLGRIGVQLYVCCYGGFYFDERCLLFSINCEKKVDFNEKGFLDL